ncbi:hypothetical protein ACFVFJ_40615 [Streptomyces sp. NPDC057717]|uniref:hypothetical protein n=1 Tax=Streptomyces sp. NPDC057717 TaxID=3346224 RepID=UPI0036B64E10
MAYPFFGVDLLTSAPVWFVFTFGAAVVIGVNLNLVRVAYALERLIRRLGAERLDSPADVKGEFVLYLRTFATDRNSSRFQYSLRGLWGSAGIAFTEEELLCMTMARAYGQVVALGCKEDYLPQVGARRLYASDKEWKDWVRDLASRATLVMVQLNEGKHTEWELRYVAKHLPRDRIVLLVPRKMHKFDFLQKFFGYFSTSSGLIKAYAGHLAALKIFLTPPRGDVAEQTEYFSVICFDDAGVAHHESVGWANGVPPERQNLVRALGLDTLFRLNNFPLDASLYRGMAGMGCCSRPLIESHSRRFCTRTDEQCLLSQAGARLWNLHCDPWIHADSCCPSCLTDRQSSGGSQ